MPWDRVVRLSAYEGPLREAILDAKFGGWPRLAVELGHELGTTLERELREAGRDPARAILVPVPTSWRRRFLRGVDHTRLIARGARSTLRAPVASMLARSHRPPQASLSLDARRRNVARTMRAISGLPTGADTEGTTIVIVDDVMTSGATMREAMRAMTSELVARPAKDRALWVALLAVTSSGSDSNGYRTQ